MNLPVPFCGVEWGNENIDFTKYFFPGCLLFYLRSKALDLRDN